MPGCVATSWSYNDYVVNLANGVLAALAEYEDLIRLL